MHYDHIIVGGGMSGSTLARVLALAGARVLLIEKTGRFSDRIRGEGMHPWGVAETRTLGIYDLLLKQCALEVPRWTTRLPGRPVQPRDLSATTPAGTGVMDFYHPEMQQTLLEAAAEAGAEVWRKAHVTGVHPGSPARIEVAREGLAHDFTADLIVGADGRDSDVRRLAGLPLERDADNPVVVAGLRMRGLPMDSTSVHVCIHRNFGALSIFFPTGEDSWRAYYADMNSEKVRSLTGRRNVDAFIARCVEAGADAEWFADAETDGPLANFDGADRWVACPATDGVALVGDAAGSPDPSWGSGLAMSLRSVRMLREELLASRDPGEAARRYAERQAEDFRKLQVVESFNRRTLFAQGAEADAFREKAFARFAEGTAPDMIGLGPDNPPDRLEL
ncbi:MAG: FAD-dependent oxidoreductase [Alphaproteobacteria bacterium]